MNCPVQSTRGIGNFACGDQHFCAGLRQDGKSCTIIFFAM